MVGTILAKSAIIEYMEKKGGASHLNLMSHLCTRIGCSRAEALQALKMLRDEGKIGEHVLDDFGQTHYYLRRFEGCFSEVVSKVSAILSETNYDALMSLMVGASNMFEKETNRIAQRRVWGVLNEVGMTPEEFDDELRTRTSPKYAWKSGLEVKEWLGV